MKSFKSVLVAELQAHNHKHLRRRHRNRRTMKVSNRINQTHPIEKYTNRLTSAKKALVLAKSRNRATKVQLLQIKRQLMAVVLKEAQVASIRSDHSTDRCIRSPSNQHS